VAHSYVNATDQEFNKQISDYEKEIAALALLFLLGEITRDAFTSEQIRLTERMLIASVIASGGVLASKSVLSFLSSQQTITAESARALANDIESGVYSEQKNAESEIIKTEEVGKAQLLTRLLLWGFTMGQAYAMGQLTKPAQLVRLPGGEVISIEPFFKWVLGPTEHCNTCFSSSQEGVKSQSFWANLARLDITPQGGGLDCKGFRCQCELVEVPIESLINIGIVTP